jgi:Tol biopolymer transport system component
VFAPPDFLLFVRQETLFAQRLSLEKLEPVGDPFPVAEQVVVNPSNFASVALSASAGGPLVYRAALPVPRQLIWFDRSGKQTGTIGEPDTADPSTARASPDGRTVALTRRVSGNTDVWLISTVQGIPRRFTFDAATDQNPTWSPDGRRIFFQSARKGGGFYDLYQKPVTGAGAEELLFESPENKNILDCSPDGRFILYASQSPRTARDLWALPLEGERKPFVVVQTGFEENGGRFSPDGRWIAYHSNEAGRNEVYVQTFPGPGPNARISTNGGMNAQWRGDGREIFYQAPDNRLMAVPITLSADGRSVDAGRAVALFATRPGSQYAAASDGQRFLINPPLDDAATPPITIVLNWAGRKK